MKIHNNDIEIEFTPFGELSETEFARLDIDQKVLGINTMLFPSYPYERPEWFQHFRKAIVSDAYLEACPLSEQVADFVPIYREIVLDKLLSPLDDEIQETPIEAGTVDEIMYDRVASDFVLHAIKNKFAKALEPVIKDALKFPTLNQLNPETGRMKTYGFSMPVMLATGDIIRVEVTYGIYFCECHLLPHVVIWSLQWDLDITYDLSWIKVIDESNSLDRELLEFEVNDTVSLN
jgi:hypothetical protein